MIMNTVCARTVRRMLLLHALGTGMLHSFKSAHRASVDELTGSHLDHCGLLLVEEALPSHSISF